MFPLWPAGEGNVGCRREAVAGSSETGCCEAPPRGLGPYGFVGGASEWGVPCEPVRDGLFRGAFLRDGLLRSGSQSRRERGALCRSLRWAPPGGLPARSGPKLCDRLLLTWPSFPPDPPATSAAAWTAGPQTAPARTPTSPRRERPALMARTAPAPTGRAPLTLGPVTQGPVTPTPLALGKETPAPETPAPETPAPTAPAPAESGVPAPAFMGPALGARAPWAAHPRAPGFRSRKPRQRPRPRQCPLPIQPWIPRRTSVPRRT